jgi:hypothetical protein
MAGTPIPEKKPTRTTAQLPCVVIPWQDKLLCRRVSVVFTLLSGRHPEVNMEFCVSTDHQKYFIVPLT